VELKLAKTSLTRKKGEGRTRSEEKALKENFLVQISQEKKKKGEGRGRSGRVRNWYLCRGARRNRKKRRTILSLNPALRGLRLTAENDMTPKEQGEKQKKGGGGGGGGEVNIGKGGFVLLF